jgi:3-oxoacyl-[acyl-carrier protein] reductase
MQTIRGKRALVTGAASGIGRAIALELARQGANLFLIDINERELNAAAGEVRAHGVEAVAVRCDLSQPAQISDAVNSLRATWGGLNILVNNAGVAYYGPTHLMTGAQWHRIMAVNLNAPIQLIRELLPVLLSADDAHIVNVCSMWGLFSWRKMAAYQTTKFALVGLTAALRAEYQGESFGVTALCPGYVRTPLLEVFETPDPDRRPAVPWWIGTTPERVAARTVRAIRRNHGLVLITPVAHLYWRIMRLSPGLVDWLLREGWRRRGKPSV